MRSLLLSWSAQQGRATSLRRNELDFVARGDPEPPASMWPRGLRVTKLQLQLMESRSQGRSQLLLGARARWRWHGWGFGVRRGAAWPHPSQLPPSQDAWQSAQGATASLPRLVLESRGRKEASGDKWRVGRRGRMGTAGFPPRTH